MNRRFLFAFLLFFSRHLFGAEADPTGIRVVKEDSGDTVTVSIKSKYASEFTVTIEATLRT